METHGEHKRNKPMLFYWAFIGLFIGFVIGASTQEWVLAVISGVGMAAALAFVATKSGLD